MIRVLIVDDQVVVTEGLRVILATAPTIEVVGVDHDSLGGATADDRKAHGEGDGSDL